MDDQLVAANAVFSAAPLQGGAQSRNLTHGYEIAAEYLKRPVARLAALDLTPRRGKLRGSAIDVSPLFGLRDSDRDFAGSVRMGHTAGAFAQRSDY